MARGAKRRQLSVKAGQDGKGGRDGNKNPDEAWRNAEEYDADVPNPPKPPYAREGREGEEPYEFIRGGRSLFDEQEKRAPDSIRQAEVHLGPCPLHIADRSSEGTRNTFTV